MVFGKKKRKQSQKQSHVMLMGKAVMYICGLKEVVLQLPC